MDVALHRRYMDQVLCFLLSCECAFQLARLDYVVTRDVFVSALLLQVESHRALDFYQLDGDALCFLSSEGKVDLAIPFAESVLLTQAFNKAEDSGICSFIARRAVSTIFGWIKPLDDDTDGEISGLICEDCNKELFLNLILLERQRIKETVHDILLWDGITELHILVLGVGRAHQTSIAINYGHEDCNFFDVLFWR